MQKEVGGLVQDRLYQLYQDCTSVSCTAGSGAMWPQSTLEEAKALLEQLPHFTARLEDPPIKEELQQIRSALFAAGPLLAYNGHAYTCPNGHTYFMATAAAPCRHPAGLSVAWRLAAATTGWQLATGAQDFE